MPRLFFKKQHRLLTKSDFASVFDKTDVKISRGPILFLARRNNLNHPRLGLVVRKKLLKYANDRNLVKRIVREHFRLQQYLLLPLDIVVMNRGPIDTAHREKLHRWIAYGFNQLSTSEMEYSAIGTNQ